MDLIKLDIIGISYSNTKTGAFALIMEEIGYEKRKIPIIIGSFEAQSIALAMEENIKPPRPITHDLFLSLAQNFSINLKHVHIYKLENGVFYSNLIFKSSESEEEKIIDSRTSDAIALAIRFNAPIYISQNILEEAGFYLEMNERNEELFQRLKDEEGNINKEEEKSSTFENIDIEINIKDQEYDYSRLEDYEINELIKKALNEEDYESAAKLRDELSRRNKEK